MSGYTIHCFSKCLSPLTHMAGAVGNEAVVMREPLASGTWAPVISGNALRHRCVREPIARWLVDTLELSGKLTMPQLNFLFNGGSLTEKGGREDQRRIADFQELFPCLRLLGGSLPDQILSGSLLVGRGTLVCEQNRSRLESMLPSEWQLPSERLKDAECFVEGYLYTRNTPDKTAPDLVPAKNGDGDRGASKDGHSSMMLYSGQAVIPGSVFVHDFVLPHGGDLDVGALLHALELWESAGATIGGMSGRGHGRLATSILVDPEPPEGCVERYRQHILDRKDDCVAWLMNSFAPKAEKPKKSGKKTAEAKA